MRGIVHRHSNNWFEWAQAYKRQLLQPFPLSPSARVVGGRRRLSKARLMQLYRLAKSSCVGPLRVIAQRPLYDPSAIIYLCLDEGLCHHKRACVIRRQKHLRLAKRTLLNVLPISKYRTRCQSPLKSWNGQAEKGLTLQSIWESTRICICPVGIPCGKDHGKRCHRPARHRGEKSPESLRNSRLSRHWQGHKDSVIIVNKYSGVYGLHRKIAVRQVRKWLKYAIFHGGSERLTESLE